MSEYASERTTRKRIDVRSAEPGEISTKKDAKSAKYAIGNVVRHKFMSFRGVIFDVDPIFSNTEDWWLAIPAEIRPRKDQPFYHLLAENEDGPYTAYVSEQNLLLDTTPDLIDHPQIGTFFDGMEDNQFILKPGFLH